MAKASDNLFPYLHLVPAAAPSSPAAGAERVYLDSADGKLKRKDSSGTVTTIEGGGSSTPAFVGVKAYHSAAQSIPNNATTALLLNSEEYDTDSFHDTSTNTSRLTVPSGKGGYYLLQGGSSGPATAQVSTEFMFRKNGATFIRSAVGGAGDGHVNASAVVNLSATDYVELVCYQSSGSAQNIGNATGNDNQTWAAATLLGV